MSTFDDLVKLLGTDANSDEVVKKTVREVLEFALTVTDRHAQMTVELMGAGRKSRRIRLLGRDVITSQGVLLVRLLGKEVHPRVHRETAKCLADLAEASPENQIKIASYSGVLDELVSMLEKAGGATLHDHTTRCLANLAQAHGNHMKMASSGVLEALVKLLGKDGLSKVHQQTILCLTNLAESVDNLKRIAGYPGVLDALVRLLGRRGSSDVHKQVVKCLTTLASFEENQDKLVRDYPSVLAALVRLMGKNGTSSVQSQSVRCLTTLSNYYKRNKVEIVSYPGVLDALVRLLKYNWITTHRIQVQEEAARCLLKLASELAPENLLKIGSHSDALNALVRCMNTKWRTREVQSLAAECFYALATIPENRLRIVSYHGTVPALLDQLMQDVYPSGQEPAAWCLSKLANAQETKTVLAKNAGVLDALVTVLGRATTITLEPTIRCLTSLAQSPSNENKVRIASHAGVIDALMRLLKGNFHVVSEIMDLAAECLSYLAQAHENADSMSSHPGVFGTLVSLLQEDGSSAVLGYTAKCLTDLAWSEENQVKIASFPGMLNALVLLLSPRVEQGVQEQVVLCLAQLLVAPVNQMKIRSYPGALDALRRLAEGDVMSSAQEQAALWLANLERRGVGHHSNSLSELDDGCADPLTWDTMCDPVKCSDGRTYDRWTIIDNDLLRSPYDSNLPIVILCDDIDVRKRLFRKHSQPEAKFRLRRESYREKALQNASALKFDDAIKMLKNVLQWAPSDAACKNELNRIQNLLSEQQLQSSPRTDPQERLLFPESPERDERDPERDPNPERDSGVHINVHVESDVGPTSEIPVLKHGDVVRVREREGRQMAVLVFVLIYIAILSFIT